MKKTIIIRESRHIVAVFEKSKKATGYCERSNSKVAAAIQCILKWHWVEKVAQHDGFIFVKPTKTLLKMNFELNGQNPAQLAH